MGLHDCLDASSAAWFLSRARETQDDDHADEMTAGARQSGRPRRQWGKLSIVVFF